ncbi:MAG: LCP family protein [Candidatus Paceibacterota bacterium]|jgi:LCP family protein required for cell wall assembly
MPQKIKEFIKNLALVVVFIFLVFLVIYIPQNRGFDTANSFTKGFLNLGRIFELTFSSSKNLLVDDNGWTNVLVLGKPGKGNPAPNLTDTIIVASFRKNQVVLLSIPRDLYVLVPNRSYNQKINSFYAMGISTNDIKKTVSAITGQDIHYSVVVDLELLKEISEYVGGVNVSVKEDIKDPLFPGPNYSYDPFYLEKGWRHLDGEILLKYVRTRYDEEGDFGRMTRQQQVLAALRNKIENQNQFQNFNMAMKLYDNFKEHIETDISISELKSFWEIAKDLDISSSKAYRLTIKDPLLLDESYISTSQGRMFVLTPSQGLNNYTQIKQYVKEIYETL